MFGALPSTTYLRVPPLRTEAARQDCEDTRQNERGNVFEAFHDGLSIPRHFTQEVGALVCGKRRAVNYRCCWGAPASAGESSVPGTERGSDVFGGLRFARVAAATPGGKGWGPRPISISDLESGKPVIVKPCRSW